MLPESASLAFRYATSVPTAASRDKSTVYNNLSNFGALSFSSMTDTVTFEVPHNVVLCRRQPYTLNGFLKKII